MSHSGGLRATVTALPYHEQQQDATAKDNYCPRAAVAFPQGKWRFKNTHYAILKKIFTDTQIHYVK